MARLRRLAMARGVLPVRIWDGGLVVYLGEGAQLGYLPEPARQQLGWQPAPQAAAGASSRRARRSGRRRQPAHHLACPPAGEVTARPQQEARVVSTRSVIARPHP